MKGDTHDPLDTQAMHALLGASLADALLPIRKLWLLALSDALERAAVERAVRQFTVAARGRGWPVENVIIVLKEELAHETPTGAQPEAGPLLAFLVKACIDEYYGRSATELPAT